MINKDIAATNLRDIAVATLNEVEVGEVFIVKDLFRGFEWARLPQSTRVKLGSLFLVYAESAEGMLVLEKLDKTKQMQQRYRKLN